MRIRQDFVRAPDDGTGAADGAGAADAGSANTSGAGDAAGGTPAPALGEGGTLLSQALAGEKGAGEGGEKPAEGEKPAPDAEKKEGTEPEKKEEEPEPLDPKDYKLELPEGVEADDPLLVAFLEGAAKGRMDNESVQAMLTALGPKLTEQITAPFREWKTLNDQWVSQVKADEELGGAKWDATINTIVSGINLVMKPDEAKAVREALDMTGAGNNPHVIRLLHRLASRSVEQGAVAGGAPVGQGRERALAAMYPSAAKGG